MTEKRYQVFVSSTYTDLLQERQKVAQVLQSMDCIPAGMELFPAIDEEQFEFIKRVIDDCDYYILLLAGRYGSVDPEGVSFTEKEFNYAVEKGLRVIALLHNNPESLSADKRESDSELAQKLTAFRERVEDGRLVKRWSTVDELTGAVAASLQKTIKIYPAPGWIRDNGVSRETLLSELNELRKEREDLLRDIDNLRLQIASTPDGLADGNDAIEVTGTMKSFRNSQWAPWKVDTTWDRIIYHIGPLLYKTASDTYIQYELGEALVREDLGKNCYEAKVHDDIFYSLRIQLETLGVVEVAALPLKGGGQGVFWQLTKGGKRRLIALRAITREITEGG